MVLGFIVQTYHYHQFNLLYCVIFLNLDLVYGLK